MENLIQSEIARLQELSQEDYLSADDFYKMQILLSIQDKWSDRNDLWNLSRAVIEIHSLILEQLNQK
jgi:hypothetical protein